MLAQLQMVFIQLMGINLLNRVCGLTLKSAMSHSLSKGRGAII